MRQVTVEITDQTYDAATETARHRGYMSVEEFLSDYLETDADQDVPMTQQLAHALEQGIADSRAGRVMSLDELNRQHEELRAQWIQAHRA